MYFILLMAMYFSHQAIAQTEFKKGYFINNNGQRKECLIKNSDWSDNPDSFKYKESVNTKTESKNIEEIKEFAVSNETKYIRATVDIEQFSTMLSRVDRNRDFSFQQETVFLKVIVEGQATLYEYVQSDLVKFFYKTQETDVTPLLYKMYRKKEGSSQISSNNQYKQDLNTLLDDCSTINSYEDLKYKRSSLKRIFIEYNNCQGVEYKVYERKREKPIHFNMRTGLNISSLTLNTPYKSADQSVKFPTHLSPRLGLELEMTLPFNNDKWSILVEPVYRYWKGETDVIYSRVGTITRITKVKGNYSSIDCPIGLRYYMFLNEQSKLFVNTSYILSLVLSNKLESVDNSELISLTEPRNNSTLAFGGGYKWKKLSLEGRVIARRNIYAHHNAWSSDYTTLSLILGIEIF